MGQAMTPVMSQSMNPQRQVTGHMGGNMHAAMWQHKQIRSQDPNQYYNQV